MDLLEIARLEELRNARSLADVADESRAIGGGIAGRGAPGVWVNQAIGLGLSGSVPRGEIEELIGWWEAAGIEPRVDLCPYADDQLVKECSALGLRAWLFSTVFFRLLERGELVQPQHIPAGVRIEVVDAQNEAALGEAAAVAIEAFPEVDFDLVARTARHPRVILMAAHMDGKCVGVASCELCGEIAALFGGAVVESHRRRGVQQALLAARMNLAASRGARVATIGSRPRAATERNVRRMGFQVAYTKVALVRPGEGLVPMRF
jgi:GNAT superfamily N-acetyltransferase